MRPAGLGRAGRAGGGGRSSCCDHRPPQIGLDTGYWTAINHFFIWGSLAVYFAILFAMHSNGLFDMFPNQFRFVGASLQRLPTDGAGASQAPGNTGNAGPTRRVPSTLLGAHRAVSAPGQASEGLRIQAMGGSGSKGGLTCS